MPEAVRLLAGAFAEKGGLPRRKLKAGLGIQGAATGRFCGNMFVFRGSCVGEGVTGRPSPS